MCSFSSAPLKRFQFTRSNSFSVVLTLETGNFIYEAKLSYSLFYPKYLPCLGVIGASGDTSKFVDDPSFGLKRAVIPPSCQRHPNGAIGWALRKEAIP